MSNGKRHFITCGKFLLTAAAVAVLGVGTAYAVATVSRSYNVNDYRTKVDRGEITYPAHTHNWYWEHDASGHVQKCTRCPEERNRGTHNFQPNTGNLYMIEDAAGSRVHYICTDCKQEGKYGYVFTGLPEDYIKASVNTDGSKYYNASLVSPSRNRKAFADVQQITYKFFKENYKNVQLYSTESGAVIPNLKFVFGSFNSDFTSCKSSENSSFSDNETGYVFLNLLMSGEDQNTSHGNVSANYGSLWSLGMMNLSNVANYRDDQAIELYVLYQFKKSALDAGRNITRSEFVQWMKDGGKFLPTSVSSAFRTNGSKITTTLDLSYDEYKRLGFSETKVGDAWKLSDSTTIDEQTYQRWKGGVQWYIGVSNIQMTYSQWRQLNGFINYPQLMETSTDSGHMLWGVLTKYASYVTDDKFNKAMARIPDVTNSFGISYISYGYNRYFMSCNIGVKNSQGAVVDICRDNDNAKRMLFALAEYSMVYPNKDGGAKGRIARGAFNPDYTRSWGRPDFNNSGYEHSYRSEQGIAQGVTNLDWSNYWAYPQNYPVGKVLFDYDRYINTEIDGTVKSVKWCNCKITLVDYATAKVRYTVTFNKPYTEVQYTGTYDGFHYDRATNSFWKEVSALWYGSPARWVSVSNRYHKVANLAEYAGTTLREPVIKTVHGLYDVGSWWNWNIPSAQDVAPEIIGTPAISTSDIVNGWATSATIKVDAKLVEKLFDQQCYVRIYPDSQAIRNIRSQADWLSYLSTSPKALVSDLLMQRNSSPAQATLVSNNIKPGGDFVTGSYHLDVDIPLQARTSTLWVTVRDKDGMFSMPKSVTVTNIDSQAPTVTSSLDDAWTKGRVVTFTANDLSDVMTTGISTSNLAGQSEWLKVTGVSNQNVVRKYTFTGNADALGYGVSFYAIDDLKNLETCNITVRKVDNTNPVVRSVSYKSSDYNNMVVTVSASDFAGSIRGSGTYEAMDYAITTTNVQPTDGWKLGNAPDDTNHYGSCDLDVPGAGTYYIWVRDSVDLVSSPYVLTVKHLGENTSGNGYDDLGKAGSGTDSKYIGSGSPVWNANYNHHHKGFIWRDTNKVVQSGSTINMYYKRIRYTVAFDKGIGETGSMSNFGVIWGTNQSLPANTFKKEYIYKIDPQGGDCSVTELKEAWDFKNWQYKSQNTPGWGATDRALTDKENIQSNSIIVRDNQTVTLTAQWKKNTVTLPSVSLDGADFLGWFSKPQTEDVMTSSGAINYRIGGIGDKVALEGKYWAAGETPTLYAWWNYRPVFADVYEGLFFEGQKISYTDLLELVKVFDYDAQYQTLAQAAVDAYFDEAELAIDNKLNDIEEKLYKVENDEAAENLEKQAEKLYAQSEFIGEMRLRANEEVEKRFLQPYVVKLDYHRGDEDNPYKVVDEHGTQDSENKDNGVALKIIKDEAKREGYWSSHYLDTSSSCVGDVIVTYQVTDPGISVKGLINEVKNSDSELADVSVSQYVKNGVIPGSKITMEYSRPCQINFNYNPTVKPMTLQFFTGDDLGDSFKAEILKAQYAFDPEDSKSNAPWWSHKASYVDLDSANADSVPARLRDKNLNTKKRLQENLTVTGIAKIRMNGTFAFRFRSVYEQVLNDFVSPESDTTKGVAKDSIIDKGQLLDDLYAFKGNNELYAKCQDKITKKWYSITKGNIWDMLESIEVTFDTKDQWGKYSSNHVALVPDGESGVVMVDTSKAPAGYLEKYLGIKRETSTVPGDPYDPAVYQAPEQRTATIIMIYSKATDPGDELCDCGCGDTVRDCTCDSCREEGRHPIYCHCGCGKTVDKCTCTNCSDKTHEKYCQCGCGKTVDECTCEDCSDKKSHETIEYCQCGCDEPVDKCTCENCPDNHPKYCTCGCGQLEEDCRCESCIESGRHPIYCHCGCGHTIEECDCKDCPDNHPRYCQCGCGKLEKDCTCENCTDDHPKYCQCGCGKTVDKCTCKDCADKTHEKYCPCGCGELLTKCKCEDCIYQKMLCDCGCGEWEKDCTCENCPDGPHDGSKLCACGCGKTEKECTCENCPGGVDENGNKDTHEPWCHCGCGKRASECTCENCTDNHPKFCQCGCGLLEKDCTCENCPDNHPKYCQCGCGKPVTECDCDNCKDTHPDYCHCGCGKLESECTCENCTDDHPKYCTCGCGQLVENCKCENCSDPSHGGGSGGSGGNGDGDGDDDDGLGTEDDPIPFDPWEDTMDNFGLDTTRVDSRVRFIADGQSSMLGKDYIKTLNQSFWSKGLGSSILDGSFNAEDNRNLRDSHSGEYEDRQGNKVPVTVKDYTQ